MKIKALLYQAIKKGDKKVDQLLSGLIAPAYSSIKDPAGNSLSPFVLAANHPIPDILIKLLDRCGNQIHADDKGWALQHAARNAHTPNVTTLLNRCGNEIIVNSKGRSLQNAAEGDHLDVLIKLLENDSDPAVTTYGNNAALRAAGMLSIVRYAPLSTY